MAYNISVPVGESEMISPGRAGIRTGPFAARTVTGKPSLLSGALPGAGPELAPHEATAEPPRITAMTAGTPRHDELRIAHPPSAEEDEVRPLRRPCRHPANRPSSEDWFCWHRAGVRTNPSVLQAPCGKHRAAGTGGITVADNPRLLPASPAPWPPPPDAKPPPPTPPQAAPSAEVPAAGGRAPAGPPQPSAEP